MARLLLIEDEENLRTPLRAALVAMGHTVAEAAHGRDGVAQFRQRPADLVITDLVMPVMEGIETISTLRKIAPTVPIIAISEGTPYLRVAQKLGANQVLAKPFSQEELDAALRAALGLTPPAAGPRAFLVLDDNPDSRFLNRALLESEFPDSLVVESGTVPEALAATAGRRFDAVITDHHLGESDGGEFVAALRARGASCPIVMVTGSGDPRVHARALSAGAARVFHGTDLDFTGYLRTALTPAAQEPQVK